MAASEKNMNVYGVKIRRVSRAQSKIYNSLRTSRQKYERVLNTHLKIKRKPSQCNVTQSLRQFNIIHIHSKFHSKQSTILNFFCISGYYVINSKIRTVDFKKYYCQDIWKGDEKTSQNMYQLDPFSAIKFKMPHKNIDFQE